MNEVVHDVDVVEGRLERGRVVEVATGDLDAIAPRDTAEFVGCSGQRTHRETAFQQAWHQASPDVTGGTGHQAPQLFRRHPRLRSSHC